MNLAHQRLQLAVHSRTLLVPVVATALVLTGAFFPASHVAKVADAHEAWAFSATAVAGLAAWFVVAIDRAVPVQADAMLAVCAGGAAAGWRARLVLVSELAAALTIVFLAVPEAAGAVPRAAEFGDVVAATLTLAGCAAVGGAFGLVLGRPVRAGTAFAAVILMLSASAAAERIAPVLAGPAGLSRALAVGAAGAIPPGLLAAAVVNLAYAAALAFAARRLSRWRG